MGDTVTYTAVLTIIVPCVTSTLGAVLWILAKIAEERKEREKDIEEARDDRQEISKELASFKEQVARENVTHTTLEKFETRLILTVDKLGDRIDRALIANHTTVIK